MSYSGDISRSVYAYCARRAGNLDLAEDLTSVVFMEAFRRRRKLQLSTDRTALVNRCGQQHSSKR